MKERNWQQKAFAPAEAPLASVVDRSGMHPVQAESSVSRDSLLLIMS
jgi:hypothetical protein